MKKLLRVLSACALAAVLALSLFACGAETQEGDKSVTVIVIGPDSQGQETEQTISVDTQAKFVEQLLSELKEADKLSYKCENGMVTSINGLDQTADYSRWWALYTDIEEETVADKSFTYTLEGKIFYSTLMGIASLPVYDGHTYLFVYTVN